LTAKVYNYVQTCHNSVTPDFETESSMAEKSPEKSRLLLSMVALDTPSLPRQEEMLKTLASLSGITVSPLTVEAQESTLAFPLDGNTAAVAILPAPIPWSNLEGPCETAWWWPDASEKMRAHNSHLLVALRGESGNAARQSIALTHLTAAVAAHVDAAGIYWGGGALVHDPQVFLEEARNASENNLPLHLWIDFRIESNDDGTLRLFTTGMKTFDRMEIEIPHSGREPAEVFEFAYSIADYILSRGAEVRDGHTVGRREDEKVLATHAPSLWDNQMTVLRLDY